MSNNKEITSPTKWTNSDFMLTPVRESPVLNENLQKQKAEERIRAAIGAKLDGREGLVSGDLATEDVPPTGGADRSPDDDEMGTAHQSTSGEPKKPYVKRRRSPPIVVSTLAGKGVQHGAPFLRVNRKGIHRQVTPDNEKHDSNDLWAPPPVASPSRSPTRSPIIRSPTRPTRSPIRSPILSPTRSPSMSPSRSRPRPPNREDRYLLLSAPRSPPVRFQTPPVREEKGPLADEASALVPLPTLAAAKKAAAGLRKKKVRRRSKSAQGNYAPPVRQPSSSSHDAPGDDSEVYNTEYGVLRVFEDENGGTVLACQPSDGGARDRVPWGGKAVKPFQLRRFMKATQLKKRWPDRASSTPPPSLKYASSLEPLLDGPPRVVSQKHPPQSSQDSQRALSALKKTSEGSSKKLAKGLLSTIGDATPIVDQLSSSQPSNPQPLLSMVVKAQQSRSSLSGGLGRSGGSRSLLGGPGKPAAGLEAKPSRLATVQEHAAVVLEIDPEPQSLRDVGSTLNSQRKWALLRANASQLQLNRSMSKLRREKRTRDVLYEGLSIDESRQVHDRYRGRSVSECLEEWKSDFMDGREDNHLVLFLGEPVVKKDLLQMMNSTGFATEELEEIGKIYQSGVRSLSSYMDLRGFKRATITSIPRVNAAMALRLFAVFDQDHSGILDFKAFVQGCALLSDVTEEGRIRFCFRLLDEDNSGSIDAQEFLDFVRSSSDPSSGVLLDKGLAEEIVNCLDADRNGEVSLEEFVEASRQQPILVQCFTHILPYMAFRVDSFLEDFQFSFKELDLMVRYVTKRGLASSIDYLTYSSLMAEFFGLKDSQLCRKLFDLMDEDNSGTVELRELLIGLSHICKRSESKNFSIKFRDINRMYQYIQGNGYGGSLTLPAFRSLMKQFFDLVDHKEVDKLFRELDADNSGSIAVRELLLGLSRIVFQESTVATRVQRHATSTGASFRGPSVSNANSRGKPLKRTRSTRLFASTYSSFSLTSIVD
eukprot:Rmarinus@m.8759